LVWDIQQLSGLRPMVEAVDPPDRRPILLGEIDRFEDSVAPALGKLRPVIDAVHAAGGIYIADEVQPGFARTGESMWGFQRHGIAPDLVVMGKPMGTACRSQAWPPAPSEPQAGEQRHARQDTYMANRLAGITIDCADPARLASFWSALLDIAVTGEHGDDAGWATVGSRLDHRPRLTFQRVPEPRTAKVRIHLDIQVDDIGAARQQVEDLGGRWSGERHDYDDGIVMVMHDPENHEFCLVQYYDSAPA
jgi:predicted enzyme related to lactoylglutathione lyase